MTGGARGLINLSSGILLYHPLWIRTNIIYFRIKKNTVQLNFQFQVYYTVNQFLAQYFIRLKDPNMKFLKNCWLSKLLEQGIKIEIQVDDRVHRESFRKNKEPNGRIKATKPSRNHLKF